MPETIYALTLHQPWASLVAAHRKRVETRSWLTHHRGLIAIHAGKTFPKEGRQLLVELAHDPHFTNLYRWPDRCPVGSVVALAELVDCIKTENVTVSPEYYDRWRRLDFGTRIGLGIHKAEERLGNYQPGRYAWPLRNITPLPHPIPAIGRQQLWKLGTLCLCGEPSECVTQFEAFGGARFSCLKCAGPAGKDPHRVVIQDVLQYAPREVRLV